MLINSKKRSGKPIKAMAAILFFIFCIAVMPAAAFVPNTINFQRKAVINDDFDRIIRDGRALIDKEKWAKAAEKFKEAIDKYPQNKSIDAALYLLAFSYKQQKAYKQTRETLDRLLREFPNSSWVTDARVMKMEIASATAVPPGTAVPPVT